MVNKNHSLDSSGESPSRRVGRRIRGYPRLQGVLRDVADVVPHEPLPVVIGDDSDVTVDSARTRQRMGRDCDEHSRSKGRVVRGRTPRPEHVAGIPSYVPVPRILIDARNPGRAQAVTC